MLFQKIKTTIAEPTRIRQSILLLAVNNRITTYVTYCKITGCCLNVHSNSMQMSRIRRPKAVAAMLTVDFRRPVNTQ